MEEVPPVIPAVDDGDGPGTPGTAEGSTLAPVNDDHESSPEMVPMMLELAATLRSRIQRHSVGDAENSSESQLKYLSLTGW